MAVQFDPVLFSLQDNKFIPYCISLTIAAGMYQYFVEIISSVFWAVCVSSYQLVPFRRDTRAGTSSIAYRLKPLDKVSIVSVKSDIIQT